jgi:hypothetical protein
LEVEGSLFDYERHQRLAFPMHSFGALKFGIGSDIAQATHRFVHIKGSSLNGA